MRAHAVVQDLKAFVVAHLTKLQGFGRMPKRKPGAHTPAAGQPAWRSRIWAEARRASRGLPVFAEVHTGPELGKGFALQLSHMAQLGDLSGCQSLLY